jgi:RNA 2',3'-cyclic 3'-phosphodiesterase
MRCFVAIDIPEKLKNKIVEIQSHLPEFNGKTTEFENLHLTLKFLGWINEEMVSKIENQLKKINLKRFEITMDSIGIFSDRIIWLNATNCNELQKEVDDKLKNLFEKENRFMGHLTIARIKGVEDKKKFRLEIKKIKIPKMKFIAKDFNLKESKLTRKGPIYSNLEAYNLEV